MLFDTHAHYDAEQFNEDRATLLSGMRANGVGLIVNAAATVASWQEVLSLTAEYPFIYGALGVHPDCLAELNEDNFLQLKELARNEKIVAIGEIGLDYYWDVVDREIQKDWFIRQLELARELALPVVIHSREAAADTLTIMQQHGSDLQAVLHAFSYSPEIAHEYIKMGHYIGVGGVVTFKNGRKLKEVVQDIPLSSIVLETDCPYLAPTPFRGKRNNSTYLKYVAEEIAQLKGLSYETVVAETTRNGCRLFAIKGEQA